MLELGTGTVVIDLPSRRFVIFFESSRTVVLFVEKFVAYVTRKTAVSRWNPHWSATAPNLVVPLLLQSTNLVVLGRHERLELSHALSEDVRLLI